MGLPLRRVGNPPVVSPQSFRLGPPIRYAAPEQTHACPSLRSQFPAGDWRAVASFPVRNIPIAKVLYAGETNKQY